MNRNASRRNVLVRPEAEPYETHRNESFDEEEPTLNSSDDERAAAFIAEVLCFVETITVQKAKTSASR